MLALGSPPGHCPGAVDHPGGREAGWGQAPPAPLAPLWPGRLHPLLRGLHAAALCRLHSAPGFLEPEVTPPTPPCPVSIYKTPVQTPSPPVVPSVPTKDTSESPSPHKH